MAYVMGVDAGTESLRAYVFDLTGRSIGSGVSPYPTTFPAPGQAEQDPRDWWTALGSAVRAAVRAAGIDSRQVEALCVDSTSCTVVVLDDAGQPLRPSIIWMDVRAETEARLALATGDAALVLNGAGRGPVSSEWMIPKALWLKRHERALYTRAATICEYQDFLIQRLTGRKVASLTNASIRWHYRNADGGWPTGMLAALELEDLQSKWPRDILAPGEVVGPLIGEAAEHLGLSLSTLVVQGGADAFIGMIGLGVSQPGQVALITGSSHLQLAVTERPVSAAGLWGAYADAVYPGRSVLEGGQSASGSMVAWLTRLLGPSSDFDDLNREAAKIAPGSEGLVALDHFQGNRTPHTDAQSRGAIVGLSLSHTRAHIFRAMIESVCLGTRAILDTMADAGVRVSELIVGGGATRSPLWLQIHADAAKLPVKVARVADAPALGCAVLAAVGARRFPNIDAGMRAMTAIGHTVEPNREAGEIYDQLLRRYQDLYGSTEAVAGYPRARGREASCDV